MSAEGGGYSESVYENEESLSNAKQELDDVWFGDCDFDYEEVKLEGGKVLVKKMRKDRKWIM